MHYFDHDTAASKDSKILMLRKQYGGAAVDAYWSIIEILYTQENPLVFSVSNPETYALLMWLCTDFDQLNEWVNGMLQISLLVDISEENEPITLWSGRVGETIELVNKKAETARQNGKKGGRPRSQKPTEKPKETKAVNSDNPEESKSNQDKSYLDIDLDIDLDLDSKKKVKRKTFTPPTVEEVKTYIGEKSYAVNAQRFVDFYESKDWMVGKNKMTNWKAAVRNWESRDKEKEVSSDADFGEYANVF